jgi:hypothetical protein
MNWEFSFALIFFIDASVIRSTDAIWIGRETIVTPFFFAMHTLLSSELAEACSENQSTCYLGATFLQATIITQELWAWG